MRRRDDSQGHGLGEDLSENGVIEPRRFYESPFTDISPQWPRRGAPAARRWRRDPARAARDLDPGWTAVTTRGARPVADVMIGHAHR